MKSIAIFYTTEIIIKIDDNIIPIILGIVFTGEYEIDITETINV